MTAVIETENLTKIYEGGLFSGPAVTGVKNLNLEIARGEIFAYLGPNGSGKTTTIKLLLTLIFPTSGTIKILGRKDIDSNDIRRKIGYVPEGAYYPDFLRGDEVLHFYGSLYGLSGADLATRIDTVLGTVGMSHARKRLVRGYSKGMRQRIGLAQALLSNPDILILDEPTTGLDPLARTEIRDILANLRDEGKTLLISSHELLEVELISDRVGILYGGELQICGTLDELLTDRDMSMRVVDANETSLKNLAEKDITSDDVISGSGTLKVPTSMSLFDAIEQCKREKVTVISVAPKRETLEELFVRVVGTARQKELSASSV